jgi:hypothetical protein
VIALALSALISAAFATLMGRRYIARRRPYQIVWAIGLAMFAVANAAALLARTGGATAIEYQLFYLFGAILNVAWLALGTLFLLAPPLVARWSLLVVLILSTVAVVAVFSSPVDLTKAVDTGRGFEASPLPRILAGIGSGVGSIVLFGGAIWSAFSFMRRRQQGRRALANLLIAAGVLVAAFGGAAAFTGASGFVEWTNLVAISLIFAGFLLV